MRYYYIAEIIEGLTDNEHKSLVSVAAINLSTDEHYFKAFKRIGEYIARQLGFGFYAQPSIGYSDLIAALEKHQQKRNCFKIDRQCVIYIMRALEDNNDAAACEAIKCLMPLFKNGRLDNESEFAAYCAQAFNATLIENGQTNTTDVPEVEPSNASVAL